MIRQELYKIFANKVAVFLVLLVFAVNIFQLVFLENSANPWTPNAYNKVWERITDDVKMENAGGAIIKERISELILDKTAEWNAKSSDEQVRIRRSGEGIYAELQLLDRVQQEIDFALGYNTYLAGVEETAERYKMLSIFAEQDAYVYREILIMKELYGELEEKQLVPEPSAGIRMASHSDVTDILALVLLLYLTVTVWLKEREQNMLLLIRTTTNGRVKLAMCKMVVLIFLCLCIAVVLYATNFFVAGWMYDMGELARPLASVSYYRSTLWEITVGEFLFFNIVFKVFSYIFIMMLISFICLCVHSSVAAFSGIVLVAGMGCLMYYKIPALSVWTAFKYLNPFGVLKTEIFFEGFKGLNFFNYPVDYRYCMIVLFVVGYIIFGILTVRFFTDYIIKGKRKSLSLFKRVKSFIIGFRRKFEKHTNIMLHEIHRILIHHGALAVIIIATVLIVTDVSSYKVRYNGEEGYYEACYLKALEGPVTDEKIDFINAEEERLRIASDDMEKAQKKAIKRIKARLAYIEENDAYFIYDTPHYEFTAGYRHDEDCLWAVYVMILLVLCMPGFFAPDLQSGMYRVIQVTARGRKKLKLLRYVFGGVLTVLFVMLVHLVRFVYVMHKNEMKLEVLTYPANSIVHLVDFGTDISVGTYYLMLYFLWILSAMMGAMLIYRLSAWIKSPAYTMLAGMVVLIFPMLIALYNGGLEYTAYPHSVFAGNLFLRNKNALVVCIVVWGLFFVADRVLTVFARVKRRGK